MPVPATYYAGGRQQPDSKPWRVLLDDYAGDEIREIRQCVSNNRNPVASENGVCPNEHDENYNVVRHAPHQWKNEEHYEQARARTKAAVRTIRWVEEQTLTW